MALAALPDDTVAVWWITLAIGLVVTVVVVLLLQALLREVESLDESVDRVLQTAGTVARNTGQSWMIGATAASVEDLRDEALRHDALLTSVLAAPAPAADRPAAAAAAKGPRGWS
jgi:hypothetical protein